MDLSNQNVVHIKKDGIQYLQFRKLLEYKDIVQHGYSLGTDINFRTNRVDKKPLSKQEYNKAIQNYKNLCDSLESNYKNVVKSNQEHTDNIIKIEGKINKEEPDINMEQYEATDGLITNQKNLILSTTNADCILLLFFDPVKKVIANTHSGWKGTLQRISIKTVKKMKEEYDCNPQDIIVCMCPSIRKCHFEVEKEVKELFEKEFKQEIEPQKWIEETVKDKKWKIDTIEINKILLKREGLKEENIIDSKLCSVCNHDLIHSFRVEKEGYGLATALIELI